jgi:ectoine hydroxylase-related dioxygenase (phytanoyl-CoA dioxygenase family)
MILKDAKVGGAWAWHQDYGYWYQNGVLSPNLCSVMIAVDQATIENGCMQVIKGSHKLGRINHILSGDQAGADMERVEEAKKRLDLVHVTMEPGDALFFHSNTLHASDANESDHPRWAMICCYNAASNDPYKDSHHPRYTKLEKVEDDRILAIGHDHASRMQTEFADLNRDDTSAKSLTQNQSS